VAGSRSPAGSDPRSPRRPAGGWAAAIAGLLFGAVGVGLLVAAATGALEVPPLLLAGVAALFLGGGMVVGVQGWRSAQRSRQVALHPGQPWRFDHAWDPGGALDETGARARAALWQAAIAAAFVLPFHALAATQPDAFPLVAVALLDLLPVAILARGAFLLLRRRKYGVARLRFARFPYLLGEPLEATLLLGQRAPLVRDLEVTLGCKERRPVESDEGGERQVRLEEVEVYRSTQAMRGARQIELRFELPRDGRDLGTDLVSMAPRRWEIRVRGEAPGIDFDATFLVPVYAPPHEGG